MFASATKSEIKRIQNNDPSYVAVILPSKKISDKDGAKLIEALQKNNIIQRLDLSDNKLGDESAIALAEVLTQNTKLQYVNFNGNRITDSGASKLAASLERNRTLNTLLLRDNDIGTTGGSILLNAYQTSSSLTQLDLAGNRISAQVLDQIQSIRTSKNSTTSTTPSRQVYPQPYVPPPVQQPAYVQPAYVQPSYVQPQATVPQSVGTAVVGYPPNTAILAPPSTTPLNMAVRNSTPFTMVPLPFEVRPDVGLFDQINQKARTVKVASSSLDRGSVELFISKVSNTFCWTKNEEWSWIVVDIGEEWRAIPNRYQFGYGSSGSAVLPRSWALQATNDPRVAFLQVNAHPLNDKNWTTLRNHVSDTSMRGEFGVENWSINYPTVQFKGWRFFRLIQTGPTTNTTPEWTNVFVAYAFDIFGQLTVVQSGVELEADNNTGVVSLLSKRGEGSSITVRASTLVQGSVWDFVSKNRVSCWTGNFPNSWFSVDFGNYMVKPTAYQFGYGSSGNAVCPKNWALQATNNKSVLNVVHPAYYNAFTDPNWVTLSSHQEDTTINSDYKIGSWNINNNSSYYSCFRIIQTGNACTLDGWQNVLVAYAFDVFGEVTGPEGQIPNPVSGIIDVLQKEDPAKIKVTCSSIAQGTPEIFITKSSGASCWTQNYPYSWFCVDLGNRRVVPTEYQLGYGSPGSSVCPRFWLLQATNEVNPGTSVDDPAWITLKSHNGDQTLNSSWAVARWPITNPGSEIGYRMFRIIQTAPCCTLGGWENVLVAYSFDIFGRYSIIQPTLDSSKMFSNFGLTSSLSKTPSPTSSSSSYGSSDTKLQDSFKNLSMSDNSNSGSPSMDRKPQDILTLLVEHETLKYPIKFSGNSVDELHEQILKVVKPHKPFKIAYWSQDFEDNLVLTDIRDLQNKMKLSLVLTDQPQVASSTFMMVPVEKSSQEFDEVEMQFRADFQNHHEYYVAQRVKNNQLPITFVLINVVKVINTELENKFNMFFDRLKSLGRNTEELKVRRAYHGTRASSIESICKNGLLKVGNPKNPSQATDPGWFGDPKKGVYVSRHVEYTTKYSNNLAHLEPGDRVKIIMFKVLPGKSFHVEVITKGMSPTEGYDSHSSPSFLEWYLFDEAQTCPQYVLEVQAIENTRVKSDDGSLKHTS